MSNCRTSDCKAIHFGVKPEVKPVSQQLALKKALMVPFHGTTHGIVLYKHSYLIFTLQLRLVHWLDILVKITIMIGLDVGLG